MTGIPKRHFKPMLMVTMLLLWCIGSNGCTDYNNAGKAADKAVRTAIGAESVKKKAELEQKLDAAMSKEFQRSKADLQPDSPPDTQDPK